jgi:predicted GIY-YIG superfamily endonuclease
LRLVWSQEFSTREEAKEAESRIKKWNRAKKEALIRGDMESLRSFAQGLEGIP